MSAGTPDQDAYRAALAAAWPGVRRAFNYPLIRQVRLTAGESGDAVVGGDAPGATDRDTAAGGDPAYRWNRNEVVVSAAHLDALVDAGGGRVTDAVVRPLLVHEVGHYACFPRELAHHLLYLRRARTAFGDDLGDRYYAVYADACNDLRLLASRLAGEDLLTLRERTLVAIRRDDGLADGQREAGRRIQRLLLGLYGQVFPDLASAPDPSGREADALERLRDVEFLADGIGVHERNLVRFGEVLDDLLADLPRAAVRTFDPPEDRGKRRADRPFAGDAVGRIPEAALDDALSTALAEGGKWSYERLREFLREETGFEETEDAPDPSGSAGLDRAGFERNDGEVPFYRRWGREFPLYVAESTVSVETDGLYRSGRRRYEAGDPLRDVNPFASLGLVGVPGVSQVDIYDEGSVTAERRAFPDLLVGIDSSGSMPHPAEESHAVLAGFLLAGTYFRNGARVGGYNFSAEAAFLPPGRDLGTLYALLCARWGGGTVLDWAPLARWVEGMEALEGIVLSEAGDHGTALSRLAEGEGDPPDAPDAFGELDHVLITDGDLANEEEAAAFLEAVADRARNLLFVTDGSRYGAWAERDLPNTWVYRAAEPEDLLALAVGQARRRASGDGPPGVN